MKWHFHKWIPKCVWGFGYDTAIMGYECKKCGERKVVQKRSFYREGDLNRAYEWRDNVLKQSQILSLVKK